jgi:hypothetical protein
MYSGNVANVRNLDLEEIEKLCALYCTQEEIAAWCGVSLRAIEERRKNTGTLYDFQRPTAEGGRSLTVEKLTFKEIMDNGYARGRVSIRRQQIKLLEAGGPGSGTMAVWLGKQILGQRDSYDLKVEEVTAPDESYAESVRRRVLGLAPRTNAEPETSLPN